jgi:hypothetical protein
MLFLSIADSAYRTLHDRHTAIPSCNLGIEAQPCANTIAIDAIYQNLSIFVSIFALNLLNIEPQLFFYIENPDDRENGLWIHTA